MPGITVDVAALQKAVDAKRQESGQSWRELARELSLGRTTLARMTRGQRPDVDSFVTLVHWLGVPAETFVIPAPHLSPAQRSLEANAHGPLRPNVRPGHRAMRSVLRLIVVGSGGGTRLADGANSGYIATNGGASLLLDCGPGVATRLRRYLSLDTLVGVVVSHTHFDNYYDLLPLAVMVYGGGVSSFVWEDERPPGPYPGVRLPVYLPPGGVTELAPIIEAVGMLAPTVGRALEATLDLHEYGAGDTIPLGPFAVQPLGPVAHGPGACFGFRVTDGEATIGYTGDSAMCDALYDIARDADLFLSDATGITSGVQRQTHLSADEAGRVAARAGARHLVLTHVANAEASWHDALFQAASAHYQGAITIARDGDVLALSPR